MTSTNDTTRQPKAGMKIDNGDISPFDDLSLEYDAWFDREGSRIFFIEVQAFKARRVSITFVTNCIGLSKLH